MIEKKQLSLKESILILVLMLVILGALIINFKMPAQIPILFVFTLLLFLGRLRNFSWDELFNGVVKGITPGIIPMIIFMLIGVLVATWLESGTIATVMVYGFKILSANFFLPTIFLICSIIGITVGSSFTTISTMGIAFMGIGSVLGFNPGMTAGAIVSGAFLGNCLSPLSDISNLIPGVLGTDLYGHIKNMAKSAIPSGLIAMVIYFFLGNTAHQVNFNSIKEISTNLSKVYVIDFWALLPIIVLIICSIKKVPAIPTILAGSITAVAIAFIRDGQLSIAKLGKIIMEGNQVTDSSKVVNKLMSGGGINNMMGSISLILLALSLGGILMELGVIEILIKAIAKGVNIPGKLILMTWISSLGINVLVGEQYLSIILPGTTFINLYKKMNVPLNHLGRTLVNGADLNAIVPWGVSGIFIVGTLGVSAVSFIPFALFCLIDPIINLILAFTVVTREQKKLSQPIN